MKIFKFLLQNSRWSAAAAVLTSTASGVVGAWLIAYIHSALSRPNPAAAPLVWGYAALCLLLLVTHVASQILLLHISQRAVYDLRLRLSRSILDAPLRRVEEAGAPRLLAALTGDVSTISGALLGIPLLCINIATIVTCLVYIGFLSWRLLVGLTLFMLASALVYRLTVKTALRYLKLAREEADTLFANLRGVIEGNKELKLNRLRREEFYRDDVRASAARVRGYNVTGQTIFTVALGSGRLLYFVFIGLILFAMPALTPTSAADLTGYVLVVLYLNGPITTLVNVIPTLSQARVALGKVESLGLSLVRERPDAPPADDEPRWSSLALEGVTHTYRREKDDGDFTLGPLDLSLRPGELLFVTGGNGSGKSTLAKLITGLYVPEGGSISVDGRPVTDATREQYRQLFSAVFSDYYLFDRVAGSNGSHALDLDARARHYLTQLQLDGKVSVSGGRLSTTDLSRGQRKRLALLNAYLEDRPLYVFDEWASDQDPLFKHVFYTQLLPDLKARGKTVVVVSHDDAYYGVADRIFKLDYGQHVET
ncbi:MAG TPA: cyclic peptide export ABC transporter [Pyrinomonadaceae bacterium]|nr:cyclic peptide export ABC transporter [Pyrinomonadaceae bacterium]